MARSPAGWKLSSADKVVTAEVEGEVNDQFDYERLLDELEEHDQHFEQVAIDCGGITRLNSQGVRNWLTFVRKLHDELSDPTSPPRYPHPTRAGAVFELDEDPEHYFAFLLDTRTGMHPTVA